MTIPNSVIEQCLKNDPRGQQTLYKAYSARMFGLCLRYAKSRDEAEDILQDGFIKVFSKLDTLKTPEHIDSWISRIMINTALNHYSRQLKFQNDISIKTDPPDATIPEEALSKMSHNELLKILQGLPTGYRTVFNLYVIDGFTHKEIGEMLGISENTSKSQLKRARTSMQNILKRIL